MLGVGLAVLAAGALLRATLVVEHGVRRLLVAVRGVLDEERLGFLEALGLAAASLPYRALRGVEILVAGDAADRGCFARGGALLLLDALLRVSCGIGAVAHLRRLLAALVLVVGYPPRGARNGTPPRGASLTVR